MANFGFPPARPPRKPLQRAPAQPTVFEQLLELKWRAVPIPCSSIRVTLSHDLVHHKYYGVDGVNIEDTGLDGLLIEATIPLFNTMAAAPTESWGSTRNYPENFRKLWDAFRDRSTGELQHPEFGPIDCKPQRLVFPLEADKREGTEITASWVETTPLIDTGEADRYKGSPVAQAKFAAVNLDASLADIRSKAPELEVPAETFDSAMNKISGTFDSLALSAQLLANKPAQIASRLKQVKNSLDRARDVSMWPAQAAAERMEKAINSLMSSGTSRRPTKIYRTKNRTTLVMVASTLKADINDLVKLNPNLLSQPDMLEGTVVRYYG